MYCHYHIPSYIVLKILSYLAMVCLYNITAKNGQKLLLWRFVRQDIQHWKSKRRRAADPTEILYVKEVLSISNLPDPQPWSFIIVHLNQKYIVFNSIAKKILHYENCFIHILHLSYKLFRVLDNVLCESKAFSDVRKIFWYRKSKQWLLIHPQLQ